LVAQPKLVSVSLSKEHAKAILALAGQAVPGADVLSCVESLLGAHLAIANSVDRASVAETIELLRRIMSGGRKRRLALCLLAHPKSGVDAETHEILGPLAIVALGGSEEAMGHLVHLASARVQYLEAHPRVESAVEALGFLCGNINLLFQGTHGRLPNAPMSDLDRLMRRRFALEILSAGDITTPDFDRHPERLDAHLDSDVVPHWTV
jgi:hypothetical protein